MTARRKWETVRFVLALLYLEAGWLVFTGSLEVNSVLAGLAFSVLTALFTFRFFIAEDEAHRKALLPRFHVLVVYLAVLIFEIYRASFKMLWDLLRGRFQPRIVHFRTRLLSDTARVMLACSITLTPGTISLDLDDDHLIVHWFSSSTTHSKLAAGIIKGRFEGVLMRMLI